jgi:hypothetical protein
MSFFEDASIVLIPSGIKNQKIYSVKPTDGTGDLTFSRASSATRVQSDGLIEKVRTNLALYSEDLTNAAYIPQNATLTGNTTTAPDGTTTADTFNEGTLTTAHRFYQQFTITANQEYAFSFYAKKNTIDIIRLVVNDLSENFRWFGAQFDLTNGTITATATGSTGGATYIGGSITNVGNGWYRCSVNGTINTTTAACFVHSSTSTAITSSDDRGGISYTGTSRTYFGWGFQFETGVTTAYIATTTAAVSVGPVSGLPRLDYLGSTCPRLLLEPQRTNLVTYSEQFDNAAWIKTEVTVTANNTTSPDGYVNADKVIPTATNSTHYVDRTGIAVSSNGLASVFVKKGEYQRFGIRSYFSGGFAIFDVNTGVIINATSVTAKIENYGNGWYRCSVNDTVNANYGYQIYVLQNTSTGLDTFAGNGTDGIFVYGAQVEVGAYATSYIPTLGASVTRVAESAVKASVTSLIGQTEGTIFMDAVIDAFPTDNSFFGVEKTASSFVIRFGSGGSNVYAQVYNGTTNLFFEPTAYTLGTRVKLAFAYKAGSYAFYKNGTLVATGTTATTIPACDSIMTNSLWGNTGNGKHGISQALLFTTRLTNAQLAELTA